MKEIYTCKNATMNRTSISVLFGKSPLISYVCGKCNLYNEVRIPIRAIQLDKPYVRCENCNCLNYIPVELNSNK